MKVDATAIAGNVESTLKQMKKDLKPRAQLNQQMQLIQDGYNFNHGR